MKKSAHQQRISKHPTPNVDEWVGFLGKALRIRRQTKYSAQDNLVRTAALISLFGPPSDSKAVDVYQLLVAFLFSDQRIPMWPRVVLELPASVEEVAKITNALRAAGFLEPLERANFDPFNFLNVARQLPDPRGYVDVCKREHHKLIRSAFHPNTLEYIASRYRGVVGVLADPKYIEEAVSSIRTVR